MKKTTSSCSASTHITPIKAVNTNQVDNKPKGEKEKLDSANTEEYTHTDTNTHTSKI